MIEGMEAFIGKKLKPAAIAGKIASGKDQYYIITRPGFYSDSIHINMYIYFDQDGVITGFAGDKCYSVYRGMYNRSASVHVREVSKRDIQYLRSLVRRNTES